MPLMVNVNQHKGNCRDLEDEQAALINDEIMEESNSTMDKNFVGLVEIS